MSPKTETKKLVMEIKRKEIRKRDTFLIIVEEKTPKDRILFNMRLYRLGYVVFFCLCVCAQICYLIAVVLFIASSFLIHLLARIFLSYLSLTFFLLLFVSFQMVYLLYTLSICF